MLAGGGGAAGGGAVGGGGGAPWYFGGLVFCGQVGTALVGGPGGEAFGKGQACGGAEPCSQELKVGGGERVTAFGGGMRAGVW